MECRSNDKWLVHSLRLTVFLRQKPVDITQLTWWDMIAGEESESSIEFRKGRTQMREHGPYKGGELTLGVVPGRIDWLFGISLLQQQPYDGILSLGAFNDATELFDHVAKSWFTIDDPPEIDRIAFGAVLIQPVETPDKGYQCLSRYVPGLNIELDNLSDFLLQINRPLESSSSVSGVAINRLMKWSVASYLTVEGKLSARRTSTTHIPAKQDYACQLELDINTVPEHDQVLEWEKLAGLFDELVILGQEIAQKGDVP